MSPISTAPPNTSTLNESDFLSAYFLIALVLIATLCDWLKNLVPLFQSIRSKDKSNRNFSHVFPRLAPATCICFEFLLVHRIVCEFQVLIGKRNCFRFGFRLSVQFLNFNVYKDQCYASVNVRFYLTQVRMLSFKHAYAYFASEQPGFIQKSESDKIHCGQVHLYPDIFENRFFSFFFFFFFFFF